MKDPFKKYKVRALFFGSFFSFMFLLLVVVTWVSYHSSIGQMTSNTSAYQEMLLDQTNQQLNIQMRAIEEIAVATSRDANLLAYLSNRGDFYSRYLTAADLTHELLNVAFSVPVIQSIQLYLEDPPSGFWQSPLRYEDFKTMNREPWYGLVKTTDFFWSGEHPITTYSGTEPVITFRRKVMDKSGDFRALLAINVKVSDIKNIVQGETPASKRVLFDSGGRVITSTGSPSAAEQDHIQGDLEAIMKDSLRHQGFKRVDDSFIVWSKPFNSDWLLIQVTPWSELTRGSLQMAWILFVIGLVAALAALAFTLALSRQFTKPLLSLVGGMSRYPVGGEAMPTDYENEFGLLFRGYASLTGRITDLYKSLEDQYRRQREAEIAALQAMINPHFLYNTLDQINWMAIAAGQERISRVLELTGKMFRIGLSNGESLILVRDELTHLECYLQIQQIRWGEGLTYELHVPEPLKDLYVPKLTLQPLVENAVIHGFNGRPSGRIEVSAADEADHIVWTVRDDGIGYDPSRGSPGQKIVGGYGLRNLRERLCAFFGDGFGTISLEGSATRGTTVTFRTPKLRERRSIGGGLLHVENRDH